MKQYVFAIEALDNGFLLFHGEKREMVSKEDLSKKIGTLLPVLGVQPKDGKVIFCVDACKEKQFEEELQQEVPDELLAAKIRYLNFHTPLDSDQMPVLNFTYKDEKDKAYNRIEIFGDWAVKAHERTNLPILNSGGISWMVVGESAEGYKMIAQLDPVLLDVTDEIIIEWNNTHPSILREV